MHNYTMICTQYRAAYLLDYIIIIIYHRFVAFHTPICPLPQHHHHEWHDPIISISINR